MKKNKGAAVLSMLLYAQGLLGIAAVAAVVMKTPAAHVSHAPAHTAEIRLALHQPAR